MDYSIPRYSIDELTNLDEEALVQILVEIQLYEEERNENEKRDETIQNPR